MSLAATNPELAELLTSSDASIKKQSGLVEELRASPYFGGFQPRAYTLYSERHYRPVDYLEQVGIEKIGEMIQHDMSLMDVCSVLDVSSRVMRKWLQNNPDYMTEIEAARMFAADEERAKARRVLYDTSSFPDTPRAKAIADHHQWTAERWNKDLYGTKQVKVQADITHGVSYQFNINVAPQKIPAAVDAALEGVYEELEKLPEPDAFVQEAMVQVALPSLDFTEGEDE